MAVLALVLAAATGSGELVLKEKARVPGRFVRLVDLLDPARGSETARGRVGDVWLGRAPADGEVRRITADEIRLELERRGFASDAFALVGREVAVEAGTEADVDPLRRRVAVESKRAVREVAVAAREIPAGTSLGRADLDIRRVEADAAEGLAIDDALGAVAAVRIRKGAAVAASDLKLKPCVRRGDVVRLVCAAYEVDARAIEDGAAGREIDVEIAASKARVRGRVTGAGRVEAR